MAGPFLRNQWTRWTAASGTLTLRQAVWRQPAGGTAQTLDGGVIPVGSDLSSFRAPSATGSFTEPYLGFVVAGGYDSTRRRVVFCRGGGHGTWSLWEVNENDFVTGTWNPSGRPQDPYTQLIRTGNDSMVYGPTEFTGGTPNSPSALRDPGGLYNSMAEIDPALGYRIFPNALHTANGFIFMPSVGRFVALGGYAVDWGGNSGTIPFEWNPTTKKWQGMFAEGVTIGFELQEYLSGCWDSTRNLVVWYTGQYIRRYNPAAAIGSRISTLYDFGSYISSVTGSGSMLYDPVRDRIVLLGPSTLGRGAFHMNMAGTPVPTAFSLSGDLTTNTAVGTLPGWVYDPPGDRYLLWFGDRTIYWVTPTTPTTFAATAYTPPIVPNSINPGSRTYGQDTPGGYGHGFAYDVVDDVFLSTALSADEQGFVVFAPLRTTPYIEDTDIVAGPRTGNSDTSFGQTANTNGAYVTCYGFFGGLSPEDALSVTVNGATALVVDYGPCTTASGRSPATTYNTHMQYEQITVQVPSTATTGLGSIIVTVNGVVSAAAPFTVQTGQIYFVATTGSDGAAGRFTTPWATVAHALDTMVSGDIVYVRNGVTEAGYRGTPSTRTNYVAVLAYPLAVVEIGSATQSSFESGPSYYMAFGRLKLWGTGGDGGSGAGQAVNLATPSRLVGCLIQAPNGTGAQGTVGTASSHDSSTFTVLCNEFTNCGADPTDTLYHTLYIAGLRNFGAANYVEGGPGPTRRIVGNYFHSNLGAWRAINIFNGQAPAPNPITGHYVARNVIIDQQSDGILWGRGIVGQNWDIGNLIVRAGKHLGSGPSDSAHGWTLAPGWEDGFLSPTFPDGSFSGASVIIHGWGTTLVNCGAAGTTSSGAIAMAAIYRLWTPDMHGVNVYQTNGQPYLTSTSEIPAPNAGQWSNGNWFGAGIKPSFDVSALNVDPLFVNVAIDDYRLTALSTLRSAGAVSGAGIDLYGLTRPSAAAWDIGAYQFSGSAPPALPTAPLLTALSPSSCVPGSASFTLTVFASATQGFVTGTTVFWDGVARTTSVLNSQQAIITVPAADVATVGAHLVTATNPGSGSSNSLQFNVNFGQATLSLAWNGLAIDRVSPGITGTVLIPDGAPDGTITATLNAAIGTRTITQLNLTSFNASNTPIGIWDTQAGNAHYGLGVARTQAGALLNDATTWAVNVTLSGGDTFVVFGSDVPIVNGIEFVVGNTLTLTATLSDGLTAVGSVTISAVTAPALLSLLPSTSFPTPATTCMVHGTGFVTGAVVFFDGAAQPTTFVDSANVTFPLSLTLLSVLGAHSVTATNPGSAISNSLTLTVAPPPTQTGIFVGSVM